MQNSAYLFTRFTTTHFSQHFKFNKLSLSILVLVFKKCNIAYQLYGIVHKWLIT